MIDEISCFLWFNEKPYFIQVLTKLTQLTLQARYAEMNRKQKERVEKEKLREEEDAKKSAQSQDLGKYKSIGLTKYIPKIYKILNSHVNLCI